MKIVRGVLYFLALLAVASSVRAAGMAFDRSLMVLADDQALADAVLHAAQSYRTQAAREWLGHDLPEGSGATTIDVTVNQENTGFTWPVDSPQRRLHKIWIRAPRDEAIGGVLHHESLHAVLATAFPYPHRLPHWCEEGAASLYDGPQRQEIHRRSTERWVTENRWPELAVLFDAPTFSGEDHDAYTAANTLTQFLLTRGTRAEFLAFAADGPRVGWDQALEAHYHIHSRGELETAWRGWCRDWTAGRPALQGT